MRTVVWIRRVYQENPQIIQQILNSNGYSQIFQPYMHKTRINFQAMIAREHTCLVLRSQLIKLNW